MMSDIIAYAFKLDASNSSWQKRNEEIIQCDETWNIIELQIAMSLVRDACDVTPRHTSSRPPLLLYSPTLTFRSAPTDLHWEIAYRCSCTEKVNAQG